LKPFHEQTAYSDRMDNASPSTAHTGANQRLPTLFVSHGSPMFALNPGHTGPALRDFGETLRHSGGLKAVVVMSPHWMARQPAVMCHSNPETWHDFGGFPEPLYRLHYPAPGSVAVAQAVLDRLQAAGMRPVADAQRPFDHGAWVPLMHLLPQADVPVVQVALPAGFGPAEVYTLGAALSDLREQGVLMVGSGSMTHNLQAFFSGRPALEAPPAPYVQAFSRWVEARLLGNDLPAMLDYRAQAPAAAQAHPTDEHFLPLYFALGAAGWGADQPAQAPVAVDYLSREVMHAHLAMDAIRFH
jgi:4,5-DOPA dioxygenase extradiol